MAGDPGDNELSLGDYLDILRRRWPWVALSLVAVLALALTFHFSQTDRYRSTAAVLLRTSAAQDALGQGSINVSLLLRELENEINFAEGDAVTTEVQNRVGSLPDIEIEGASGADVLTFTATAGQADEAALAANTWAQVYVDLKREFASASILGAVDQFQQELGQLREQRTAKRQPISELEIRLTTASEAARPRIEADLARARGESESEINLIDSRIDAISASIVDLELSGQLASQGTAQIVQVAAAPSETINSPLARNLALALVVGSILGLAAALLVENLDRSISSSADVARVTSIPVLGVIPAASKQDLKQELSLVSHTEPDNKIADAYQKVRSALQFSFVDTSIRSILVTSPNQTEGKTTTAVNLALALTSIGQRVTLADIDLRRPRLHKVFGCEIEPGLTNHLLDGTPLTELAWHVKHDEYAMVVLPSGTLPPNPAQFIGSPPFAKLLEALVSEAELVVLDSAPVLPVSDTLSLAGAADATIVTVRAGSTRRDELGSTISSLSRVGANIIGIVLVGAGERGHNYYYGPDALEANSVTANPRGPRSQKDPLLSRQGPTKAPTKPKNEGAAASGSLLRAGDSSNGTEDAAISSQNGAVTTSPAQGRSGGPGNRFSIRRRASRK